MRSNEEAHIDIPMARVSRHANGLVEVRIPPDVRIDVAGVRAALQARRTLLPDGRGAILFTALGDLDWEAALLKTDLFGEDAGTITAIGVLVSNKVLAMAANMYFSLFPAAFPTRIHSDEAELRAWLATH